MGAVPAQWCSLKTWQNSHGVGWGWAVFGKPLMGHSGDRGILAGLHRAREGAALPRPAPSVALFWFKDVRGCDGAGEKPPPRRVPAAL